MPDFKDTQPRERVFGAGGDARPLILAIVLGLVVALSLTIAAAWASDHVDPLEPRRELVIMSAPATSSSPVTDKIQDRLPGSDAPTLAPR